MRRLIAGVVAAVSFGLVAGAVVAADNPVKLEGATVVSPEQARDLIAKGAIAVDARSAAEYAEGHIKGAVNVVYKEKSEKKPDFDASKDSVDLAKLPADKGVPLVTYCNGHDCWKSYKLSVAALKAGYKKIYWLRDGLPGWKGKGYAVE